MGNLEIALALFFVAYLALIAWLYGRQQRWFGATGWGLLLGGSLLAFGGGGDLFPWAGLLWAFVALGGMLCLGVDIFALRQRRR